LIALATLNKQLKKCLNSGCASLEIPVAFSDWKHFVRLKKPPMIAATVCNHSEHATTVAPRAQTKLGSLWPSNRTGMLIVRKYQPSFSDLVRKDFLCILSRSVQKISRPFHDDLDFFTGSKSCCA
jgi:hypothetical protein